MSSVFDWIVLQSFEAMITKKQLRWVWHGVRMGNTRLTKQIFLSENSEGARRRGRSFLRYHHPVKERLNACQLPLNTWESSAPNRNLWRSSIYEGVNQFENGSLKKQKDEAVTRTHNASSASQVACPIWGKFDASNFDLGAHTCQYLGDALTI